MMRKGIVSFVCIMIVAMSNIFYTTYLFAVDIALNYSPCSLLADYKENSRTINIKDDSVDYFDKWGYLSKASLLFLFPNNDKEHPYMTGYFIDILHKSVSIEPVDIKYFEKGGDIHIVSGIAGIMFRGPVKTTNIYFDFGFGIGYTAIFKDSYGAHSYGKDTDYTFKLGAGYKVNLSHSIACNFGVDWIAPGLSSYHKLNHGGYVNLYYGGIYPYIGVAF